MAKVMQLFSWKPFVTYLIYLFHSFFYFRFNQIQRLRVSGNLTTNYLPITQFCTKLTSPSPQLQLVTDLTKEQQEQQNDDSASYSTSPDVTVQGDDVPRPILNFGEIEWPREIERVISKKQFSNPTPVQCQAIPIALENRDLIGIAETGSGKTLAFILPTAVKVIECKVDHRNPQALVVAPTRELVQQIHQVALDFPSLASVPVYGGTKKEHQVDEIHRMQPKMIIATPGRLIDLLQGGIITLEDVTTAIIDEADRLLDMGFEDQLRRIFESLPPSRQTLMFSATWPTEVQSLASEFLTNPIHLTIGSGELYANPKIKQNIKFIENYDKDRELIQLLESIKDPSTNTLPKTLIFVETKRTADIICSALQRRGYFCEALHSDKSQSRRDNVLHHFRKPIGNASFTRNRVDILVATNVVARGLDVKDIEVIINYDFPNTCEDYIHRIGRTARGDGTGTAYTFFTQDNCALASELMSVLKQANQPIDPMLERLAQYAKQTKAMKRAQKKRSGQDWFNHSPRPRGPRRY